MKLKTSTVTFVGLSDVLQYMGYPHLMDDASDIFADVSYGDAVYTLVTMQFVLDQLYVWLTLDPTDQTWTDMQYQSFVKKAEELENAYTLVNMEG